MTPERRSHARRVLYSPEYLDMGSDNGGMVVNLSESGIGFQALNAVLTRMEIPISFSLGTGYRIEVRARVAWVNNTGKVGGAVFGKLSKDSLSLIHEWVAQTEHDVNSPDVAVTAIADPEVPRKTATSNAAPAPANSAASGHATVPETSIEPATCEKEPSSADNVVAVSRGGRAALELSIKQSPEPLFPPRNAENIFARSPSQNETVRERSGARKLLVVAIAVAVAAVGAFYVRTHRQQVGTTIARIGNRVAGNTDSISTVNATPVQPTKAGLAETASVPSASRQLPSAQGLPAVTHEIKPLRTAPASDAVKAQPNSMPSSTASPLNPANTSKSAGAQSNAPRSAGAKASRGSVETSRDSASGANSSPPSAASLLAGQSEYQRAEQYLNGKGVAQDYGEAAQWFWRSLEAGYTNAALPLANLYLDGSGVSRSCTQARILLDAAAQKNNVQAIQKLAQLPENCQ